jgi:hypothetical protein
MSTPSKEAIKARKELCDWVFTMIGHRFGSPKSVAVIDSIIQSSIDEATEPLRQQILNRESRWEEAERMLSESRAAQPQEWTPECLANLGDANDWLQSICDAHNGEVKQLQAQRQIQV